MPRASPPTSASKPRGHDGVQPTDPPRSLTTTPNPIARSDTVMRATHPRVAANNFDDNHAEAELVQSWSGQAGGSFRTYQDMSSPMHPDPFGQMHQYGHPHPYPVAGSGVGFADFNSIYSQGINAGAMQLPWHTMPNGYMPQHHQQPTNIPVYQSGSFYAGRSNEYHRDHTSSAPPYQFQHHMHDHGVAPFTTPYPPYVNQTRPPAVASSVPHPRSHENHMSRHGQQPKHNKVPPRNLGPSHLRGARDAPPEPTPSYPRGPPRKPKQSGFALWVGNLPPGTSIIELKEHFSRDATEDIESVFLISKSNCAFVNYRTADSCKAAMARFHEGRFRGVRLVCRLRQAQQQASPESLDTSDSASADSAAHGNQSSQGSSKRPLSTEMESLSLSDGSRTVFIIGKARDTKPKHTDGEADGIDGAPVVSDKDAGDNVDTTRGIEHVESSGLEGVDGYATAADGDVNSDSNTHQENVADKFFVVKSLTLQDLDASVRNNVWATQSHNEGILNEAYKTAKTVYLIFSANKSGEYFGYAKMCSPVSSDMVTENPRTLPLSRDSPSDGPTSSPTPATEHAPKGRVIDDSARGTIFWEADSSSDSEDKATDQMASRRINQRSNEIGEAGAKQDWGKPFHIEWICTTSLPFHKTRGLRNPWNANREVKIARDGTELEPSVGKKLLELFHQIAVDSGPTKVSTRQTT